MRIGNPLVRDKFLRAVGSGGAFAAGYGAMGMQFPAGAAEFTYKLGTSDPTEHPATVRALEAAARILRESDGRLQINVFPNNALGNDAQMFTQVRLGSVEFSVRGDVQTETTIPAAGLSAIPFAFASHQDAWRAMDGPLGAYIRAAVEKSGVYSFAKMWDHGIRQIETSGRPVHAPADLRGLKLRVSSSYVLISLFTGLGATPVALDTTETYMALQTHLVDGSIDPLQPFQDRKLYEVEKFVSMANHGWTGTRLMVNQAAWQRLPKGLQDLCERRFNEAAVRCNQDFVRSDELLQGQLTSEGCTFTRPDLRAFKAAIGEARLYAQWRDHYGPEGWGLLERAVGPLR